MSNDLSWIPTTVFCEAIKGFIIVYENVREISTEETFSITQEKDEEKNAENYIVKGHNTLKENRFC